MDIKPITFKDRSVLRQVVEGVTLFTKEERDVVLELMDETQRTSDYEFWGCWESANELSSFICYGPTPMAHGTFDMYWIGTSDAHQKKGRARMLVDTMKKNLAKQNARLIRIETSGQDTYDSTRSFYDKMEMKEVARINHFYKPSDDLVIYAYYFL